jgi:tRNA (guanine-N7-)-methyltransferase
VAKNKLAKWNELASFNNVIQPEIGDIAANDHPLKGHWGENIFKNNNPIVLELGCGKGEYSVGLAKRFPGKNYIGVDIKGARMWRGAKTADENNLNNVAFLRTRIEFVNSFFDSDEVSEIWITFPDPHPGGKNSNKRLISPWFLNNYRSFLDNMGIVHLKTDNPELYNYTKSLIIYNELEIIFETSDLYSGTNMNETDSSRLLSVVYTAQLPVEEHTEIINHTPLGILTIRTHYENLFLKKGMKINYISFKLDKEKQIEDAGKKTKVK